MPLPGRRRSPSVEGAEVSTGRVCVLREPACCGARGNLGEPGVPPVPLLAAIEAGFVFLDVVLDPDLQNDF